MTPAYSFVRTFAPEPPRRFEVDRHYLLYATRGALRLTAAGRSWSLPPARAALIQARTPIDIALPQAATTCSALFATDFGPAPPAPLAVFELTPLARELVVACGVYGADAAWDAHAEALFRALQAVTWRLAEAPSPTFMPVAKSAALARALALTEAELVEPPSFEALAATVALSPRSLARRFADELGMTWREALRRLRLIRAIEALAASDEPVTDIAFAVGYSSLSAFNAAFRDLTGLSPTAYRTTFRPA